MKLSYHWLTTWCQPNLSRSEVLEKLTLAGLEVGSFVELGQDLSDIVVAKVLEVKPHPNADRLNICRVMFDELHEPVTIVCGASNVAAGIKVVLAKVGATLPGGFTIQLATLRGVESHGMICSAQELGMLPEPGHGILILPEDAHVGQSAIDYLALDDLIMDIELTPNRGDCANVLGIARELSISTGQSLRTLAVPDATIDHHEVHPVTIEAPNQCPRYSTCILHNYTGTVPSPIWMRERLRRSDIQPVNLIVDVTQYVMLELGQPMHAFDADLLVGKLIVRQAIKGESLTLLNNNTLTLDENDLVIADDNGPQALAGVMGGSASSVTQSTKRILIESAHFSPLAINQMTQRHHLQTDASYRFMRGVDPAMPEIATRRAIELLKELSPIQAGEIVINESSEFLPLPAKITLEFEKITKILGVEIDKTDVAYFLKQLKMDIHETPEGWHVTPPSWRFDIHIEADLIEEVARLLGYDLLQETVPAAISRVSATSMSVKNRLATRRLMQSQGFHEIISYSFVDASIQQRLNPEVHPITLKNPLTEDLNVMRTNLWPGLIQAAKYNYARQVRDLKLFECGAQFTGSDQTIKIAGLMMGAQSNRQWGVTHQPLDFYDLKGVVETLLGGSQLNVQFIQSQHPALHPGQSADIMASGGEQIGSLGRVHPSVEKALSIDLSCYVFELDMTAIENKEPIVFKEFSKFPSIKRDLCFSVSNEVNALEIKNLIKNTSNELLYDIQLLDVYVTDDIKSACRSLTFRLEFQESARTLTDHEVTSMVGKILSALDEKFNINLRETDGTNES